MSDPGSDISKVAQPAYTNSDTIPLGPFPSLNRIQRVDTVGTGASNQQEKVLERRTDTLRDKINELIDVMNLVDSWYLRRNVGTQKGASPTTGVTADLPMNGHGITGLRAAASNGEAVRYEEFSSIVASLNALVTQVNNLGSTYATDAELAAAISALQSSMPSLSTPSMLRPSSAPTIITVNGPASTGTVSSAVIDIASSVAIAIELVMADLTFEARYYTTGYVSPLLFTVKSLSLVFAAGAVSHVRMGIVVNTMQLTNFSGLLHTGGGGASNVGAMVDIPVTGSPQILARGDYAGANMINFAVMAQVVGGVVQVRFDASQESGGPLRPSLISGMIHRLSYVQKG